MCFFMRRWRRREYFLDSEARERLWKELRVIKYGIDQLKRDLKMATENIDAVKTQMQNVADFLVTVDETVENLYEAVTTANEDITPALRDTLLEGLGTIRTKAEQIATKDRVTPPVEPPV